MHMAKAKTVFVCQNCEAKYPKWQGQCSQCGKWNTLVEEIVVPSTSSAGSARLQANVSGAVISFPEVDTLSASKSRLSTTIDELDRVLGGDSNIETPKSTSKKSDGRGMVPGAVMLIGGEPGIGKSTLLTQMVVGMLTQEPGGGPVVYVAGEESPAQIALRVRRILAKSSVANKKPDTSKNKPNILANLQFVTATDVEVVAAAIRNIKPRVVVVDSIQTITTDELTGAAGSVGQVRESADRLTSLAKELHIPMFLVGHVTKEGKISGPKILEHIVDAVLELSGERTGELRLLRAVKNRFGATDEVGVFRVEEYGYQSVANPSELFLEHADQPVPGSATVCVMEGTRPLLVETQALVVESQLAMPRRVGRGIQLSRIQVLSAVLQKHCRLPLGSTDVFLSVAGGYEVREPAVDLGLAVAIASSLQNKPLPKDTVFIGELGLLGEIRTVSLLDRRIKEAKRLGFEHIISRKTHSNIKAVLKQFGLLSKRSAPAAAKSNSEEQLELSGDV